MTTPYGFMTNAGRAAEADALANGTALDVAEIAWGDDPRAITGGETALGNETGRAPVLAQGVIGGSPNVAFFRHTFASGDGPFTIHEAGLFSSTGTLLAIVTYPLAISKPIGFELTLDLHVGFSDLENLIINVTSGGTLVPVERTLTAGAGLSGGGDLSQDRAFALDIASLPVLSEATADPAADALALRDQSAGADYRMTIADVARVFSRTDVARPRSYFFGQL